MQLSPRSAAFVTIDDLKFLCVIKYIRSVVRRENNKIRLLMIEIKLVAPRLVFSETERASLKNALLCAASQHPLDTPDALLCIWSRLGSKHFRGGYYVKHIFYTCIRFERRDVEGTMGRRYWIYTPDICQRLRLVHYNGVCEILVDGL